MIVKWPFGDLSLFLFFGSCHYIQSQDYEVDPLDLDDRLVLSLELPDIVEQGFQWLNHEPAN